MYQFMEASSHISLCVFELLAGWYLHKVAAGNVVGTTFSRLGGAFMLHRDPCLFCKGFYKCLGLLQRLIIAGNNLPLALQPFGLCHDLKNIVEFQESIAIIRIVPFFCRAFLGLVPAVPVDDRQGFCSLLDFAPQLLALVKSDIFARFSSTQERKDYHVDAPILFHRLGIYWH